MRMRRTFAAAAALALTVGLATSSAYAATPAPKPDPVTDGIHQVWGFAGKVVDLVIFKPVGFVAKTVVKPPFAG